MPTPATALEDLRAASTIPIVDAPPILGSALDYVQAPLTLFIDAYLRHGPLFSLRFPDRSVIVVAGEVARDLLKQDPVPGMHREGLFEPFTNEVGVDIFAKQGDPHRQVRAALMLPYSRQLAAQFCPELFRVVEHVTADWSPGDEVDLFDAGSRLALLSMMTMVTPIELSRSREDIVRSGNLVMYTLFNLRPRAMLRGPRYLAARNGAYRILEEVIERHQQGEFRDHAKMYLIDACLRTKTPSGASLGPRDIRGACLYALAGSEIYIGRIIGFLLYELLRNRAYLTKVRREIDAAFREGTLTPLTFYHMPYLRAAYYETLRYYPLLPGYPYYTSEEVEVLGHRLPPDTLVLFCPHLSHFSPELYDNPMAFDPIRCMAPRKEIAHDGAFAPFGVGNRTCLAQGIAEIITLCAVSGLLRDHDLHLSKPSAHMDLSLAPLLSPKRRTHVRAKGPRIPETIAADTPVLSETPDFDRPADPQTSTDRLPKLDPEAIEAGTVIIREGTQAEEFFVVLDGKASVWIGRYGANSEHVGNCGPGESFGETGLLKNIPRTATVRAETALLVLRFPRETFIDLVSRFDLTAEGITSLYYGRYLKDTLQTALPGLTGLTVAKLSGGYVWKHFAAGDTIIRQGDRADTFYVLAKGRVRVFSEGTRGKRELATLGEGSFFGEIGILNSQPRTASVVAEESSVCLCFDRQVLLDMVAENPRATVDIAQAMCQRLILNVRNLPQGTL